MCVFPQAMYDVWVKFIIDVALDATGVVVLPGKHNEQRGRFGGVTITRAHGIQGEEQR